MISLSYPHFFMPLKIIYLFFSDLPRVAHFYEHLICLDMSRQIFDMYRQACIKVRKGQRSSARVLQRTTSHLSEAHELGVYPTFLRVLEILRNPHETHTFMGPLDKCGLSGGERFYCVGR